MSTQMFPIIQPELAETDDTLPLCREEGWDFQSGRPLFKNGNPVVVIGREAVKVWSYKALLTQRTRYEIYTWNFGSDLETLIGQNYSIHTKRAEAIRYVQEALEINPYITDVSDIRVDFSQGDLAVSATIQTIYGEVTVYVPGPDTGDY